MKKLIIFFFIMLMYCNVIPQSLQNKISGTIVDKITKQPLSNVNIFVSGALTGIVSDKNGYYEIKSLPEGSHKLTFSLIGYESISISFETKEPSSVKYDIELSPRIYSTAPVEIKTPGIPERGSLLKSFKELFLGKTDRCRIENESVIRISLRGNNLYEFSSDTAITISNFILGYRISGRLESFKLNLKTGEYNFSFMPEFSELKSADKKVREEWKINRLIAYKGSLRHFLKSLYFNRSGQDGYVLYTSDPDRSGNVIEKLSDNTSIISNGTSGCKNVKFSGYLIVRYGSEISTLRLKNEYAAVDMDGNLTEEMPFVINGAFASKGLSSLLPDDYWPDVIRRKNKSNDETGLHEELDSFADTLQSYQRQRFEELKDSLKLLSIKHPESIISRLKYALSLERIHFSTAESEYESIIKSDSGCAEAYYRLGKLKADEFNDYRNSLKKISNEEDSYSGYSFSPGDWGWSRRSGTGTTFLFNMKEISLPLFKEAEKYFNKAMTLNPMAEDYYLDLAFLYEDFMDFNKAAEVLEKLCSENPENKYAHLYLGMLYYKAKEYRKSMQHYNFALSLMNSKEKDDFIFNSVKKLLEPTLGNSIKSLDDISLTRVIEKFWQSEDPLLLTDYNERLLEHYSRTAYASLRFRKRNSQEPGWMTDRGEILIRYGFPVSVVRLRPWVTFNGQVFTKTEIWYYDGMLFSFHDPHFTGEFPFVEPETGNIKSQMEVDSRSFARNLKKTKFEKYTFFPEGPLLNSTFRIFQFKNLSEAYSKASDLYMCLSAPVKDSLFRNNDYYKWGLYCFDSKYNSVLNKTDTVRVSDKEEVSDEQDLNSVIVNLLTIYPSGLSISAEIMRERDNAAYANHGRLQVKDFSRDSLMLSDIIISPKVIFGSGSSTSINRNGIWILPKTDMTFSKRENVHVYYEAYNLSKDANGINDYDQEIIIERKDEVSRLFGAVVNGIIKLFSDENKPEKDAAKAKLISYNKDQQMCFETNFSLLSPGDYNFIIRFRDKVSGNTAESRTVFTLLE